MITILRSAERHHHGPADRGTWETFAAGTGLGALAQLDEHRLAPGSESSWWFSTGELVTYVFDGSMAYEDSLGGVGVLHATEIQVLVDGASPHMVRNASQHAWVQGFQLTFNLPGAPLPVPRVQHRFSAAERRGHLHMVAASDQRTGSLLLRAHARIYSGLLSAGRHVVHELLPDRAAWLQVVNGACATGDLVLTTGDGASFVSERTVSITARQETEVLLVDVFVKRQISNGAPHDV